MERFLSVYFFSAASHDVANQVAPGQQQRAGGVHTSTRAAVADPLFVDDKFLVCFSARRGLSKKK